MKRGKLTIVIGGQFGSEGKGKVCGYLADNYDLAIRGGSPNAGHTIVDDNGNILKLQQIPCGIINSNCKLAIASGALIDTNILNNEMLLLDNVNRLIIDEQAGIIEKIDSENEKDLMLSIGSTGKGCGEAMSKRVLRRDFKLAKDIYPKKMLGNVSELANNYLNDNKNVIIEGTQGYGLSLYHGFYPYVTSRDTNACGFLSEVGISPFLVTDIILVIRTYPIRVAGNSGPLKNEITWEELSKRIGKETCEFTTVTKKIRRLGEFDVDIVKKAIEINRPTQIALQFLNYLFPEDEGKTEFKSLSNNAKKYIKSLEKELKVPITLIGTGPKHSEMINRNIK